VFIIQLVDFAFDKFTEKKENATRKPNQAVLSCIVMISITVAAAESIYQSAPVKERIKVKILG